jgi:hypothetical protein
LPVRAIGILKSGDGTQKDGTKDRSKESRWLIMTMAEKKIPPEAAFELMNIWNDRNQKFKTDQRLQDEIDRCYEDAGYEENDEVLKTFTLDEATEKKVDWIWPDVLARGEITIIEGDPGVGKSFIIQLTAVNLCDGKPLPSLIGDERLKLPPLRVYFCDLENSASYVTKARVRKAGLKNFQNFIQCEEIFSIDNDNDLDRLEASIEIRKPDVLVFDTINSYLGKTDSFKGTEVQQTLNKLKDISRRYNVACVILRHLRKSKRKDAIQAGQGSIAFVGIARLVLTVGRMPDDPDTVTLMQIKNGLGPHRRDLAFTYTLDESGMKYCKVVENIDVEETLSKNKEKIKEAGNAMKEAVDFLEEFLEEGPQEYKRIIEEAERKSISKTTLTRARSKLNIAVNHVGRRKERKTTWMLRD